MQPRAAIRLGRGCRFAVPIQHRVQRTVIAVGLRRLAFFELRLRAHIGSHGAVRRLVLVSFCFARFRRRANLVVAMAFVASLVWVGCVCSSYTAWYQRARRSWTFRGIAAAARTLCFTCRSLISAIPVLTLWLACGWWRFSTSRCARNICAHVGLNGRDELVQQFMKI